MRRTAQGKLGGRDRPGNSGRATALFSRVRQDRLVLDQVHDSYPHGSNPAEPNICPVCKAVFKDGHWQWVDAWPMDSHPEMCQACRRIRDNYPAGFVTVSGDWAKAHKQEAVHLARHQEADERGRHPLNRIIGIEDLADRLVITTTDLHLPKRIGRALQRAHKGQLELNYDPQGCLIRVNWTSPKSSKKNKPTNVKKRR